MMNKFMRTVALLACVSLVAPSFADAKGGSSSGGGRGGSSGGAGAARSSGPTGGGGGASRPATGTTTTAAPRTTTTTTTTTTARTSTYSSRYVSPGGMYGGWGMGYGYSNGLLTGMIIGGMMHPHGTIFYTGPGVYANNAVLYNDGRVVNRQGVLVGTYINGVFTPVENGGMVAQHVPADAGAVTAVPVHVGPSAMDIIAYSFIGISLALIFIFFIIL